MPTMTFDRGLGPRGLAVPKVSTLDLWKALALALILVDHFGHFLFPDAPWLRVIGRASLPIWFFLIGFGGGRGVPWVWFLLGASLTALDLWWVGSYSDILINILFSFAAIRFALPFVETWIWPHRWRLAALVLALIALAPFANGLVEYGTSGPIFALVGVAHRRWLAQPGREGLALRIGLAIVAALVFILLERADYGFDTAQTAVLVLLVAIVSGWLVSFRRRDSKIAFPAWAAAVLRFCGRYSLWLYAGQIVLLTAAAAALGIEPDLGEDDDEEEP